MAEQMVKRYSRDEDCDQGIGLAIVPADALKTDGIPPEELAGIQAVLGPVALYEEASIGVTAPESTNGSEDIEQFQALIYVGMVGIEGGWIKGKGRGNNANAKIRVRDATGMKDERARDALLGLEGKGFVELAKRDRRDGNISLLDARITEEGKSALECIRKDSPGIITAAEERTKSHLVSQAAAMKAEIRHALRILAIDQEADSLVGMTENGWNSMHSMVIDLNGLNLVELVRMPKKLEKIQAVLEREINKKLREARIFGRIDSSGKHI